MTRPEQTTRSAARHDGVALVIAVLVLAVLSSLLVGLSVRVSLVKRRQAFMVEYQRARYALDSAMKFAMVTMPVRNFKLTDRVGLPDFSDLFAMDGEQYRYYLQQWALTATDEQLDEVLKEGATFGQPKLSTAEMLSRLSGIFGLNVSDPNAASSSEAAAEPVQQTTDDGQVVVEIDPNDMQVPGPYGVPWPYVIKPIELEIGPSKVTITIEDENAKMPLSWTITNRETVNKEADAAMGTFFDWMGMSRQEQERLTTELKAIYKLKKFEINPDENLLKNPAPAPPPPQPQAQPGRMTTSRPTTTRQLAAQQAQTAVKPRSGAANATDFAKLFHSGLLDREALARPVLPTALPDESPLKYMGLWGSQRVNINTAPRHVLEAALTFGAEDPAELAAKIIQLRQEAPIKTLDDLKKTLYSDSMAIERAKEYLTTTSNFFLIRVVAQSGNARISAVATVIKEGRNVEQLAILYGL